MLYEPVNTTQYGDSDVPEIDVRPYQNGSRIVTPEKPLPETQKDQGGGRDGE